MVRERTPILYPLPILVPALVAIYLGHRTTLLHHRNMQSWESLVARLHPKWSVGGERRLWGMFREAGVMLEMADYAERNGTSVDLAIVNTLRRDALRIRIDVLKALVGRAYPRW